MPVVINNFEVTQEQPRATSAEPAAASAEPKPKTNPEEIRRLIIRQAERLLRVKAH